ADEDGAEFAGVVGQGAAGGFLDVVEGQSSLFYGADQCAEAIVEEDDFGGIFGDVGAGFAHGDADVGALQCRRVVDAIAGDGYDFAAHFGDLDDAQLVFRRNAREDGATLLD